MKLFHVYHLFHLAHGEPRKFSWCSIPRVHTQAKNTIPATQQPACCPIVLPRRAVASPHWVCMEAAVVSPQPLWEQLGRCNSSPMLTQWGVAIARWGSTTGQHVALQCVHTLPRSAAGLGGVDVAGADLPGGHGPPMGGSEQVPGGVQRPVRGSARAAAPLPRRDQDLPQGRTEPASKLKTRLTVGKNPDLPQGGIDLPLAI